MAQPVGRQRGIVDLLVAIAEVALQLDLARPVGRLRALFDIGELRQRDFRLGDLLAVGACIVLEVGIFRLDPLEALGQGLEVAAQLLDGGRRGRLLGDGRRGEQRTDGGSNKCSHGNLRIVSVGACYTAGRWRFRDVRKSAR